MSDSPIIERILKTQMKKLILAGPTGAGKTTIFTKIFPHDKNILSEVKRRVDLETKSEAAFTPITRDQFENSTTTVSFNITSIVACIDRANNMTIHPFKDLDFLLETEYDYILPFQVIDLAGQDRFFFMVETMIKGTNGVIFVADGSNISSLNNLPPFIDEIRKEEIRRDTKIPSVAFIHKADLKDKNMYVGIEVAQSALPDSMRIFETTVMDATSITIPLRILIMDMFNQPMTTFALKNFVNNLKLLKK